MEEELLEYFASSSGRRKVSNEGFYVRPGPATMELYLGCLGQTLMMTCVQNDYLSRQAIWGERQMFEWYLRTAVEMKDAQVPRILFLAALAKSRSYGSSVYQEYKAQSLELLKDETSKTSQFYRLSPLLFQVFGMEKEFTERGAELVRDSDPLYREWLDRLGEKK
jgi:hypothetical protein